MTLKAQCDSIHIANILKLGSEFRQSAYQLIWLIYFKLLSNHASMPIHIFVFYI